jgi:periplasmic protein TonB
MARATVLPAPEGGEDWARWSLAAAIVVAAHAGAIASYLLFAPVESPGAADAPAVIMDLAPMPVAPESQADLAPGPEMVEAQPMPEPPKLVEAQVVEPLPKIEAPAEILLPASEPKVEAQPEETPVEKPQEKPVERVQQTPPAPQTTAAPRSERRPAPAARAPNPGSTESSAAMASWRDLLVARLQRAKRYPASAEARRAQGIATLSFSVDRNGRVLSQRIVGSSGHSDLDQEVLALVQRAQPLPPFPPAMAQSVIHLSVPIRFSLR